MDDLIDIITEQADQLENIAQRLRGILSNNESLILRQILERWIEISRQSFLLRKILVEVAVRTSAQTMLSMSEMSLPVDETVRVAEFKIPFAGSSVSLEVGRGILLTSYVTHTWSLFDQMTNIIGRIIGSDEVAQSKQIRNNIKLYEGFLKKSSRQINGFSLDGYVYIKYAKYICASYVIRNSVVHNCSIVDCVGERLLTSDIANKAFDIDERIANALNSLVTRKLAEVKREDLGEVQDFEFAAGDIRWQIIGIDDKILECLVDLLKWGVDAFTQETQQFLRV